MILFLWDVDGTLIRSQGAGREAMRRALAGLGGRPEVVDSLEFAGATDPQIAAEALRRSNLPAGAEGVAAFRSRYLRELDALLPGWAHRFEVLPGVREAFGRLGALGPQALLTGNWPEGAFRKLRAAGLGSAPTWGAFGGDAPDREGLVPVALERARARGFRPRAAIVVGDTPRDVAAARAGGAAAVAVRTGYASGEALERSAPDLLVADLAVGLPAVEELARALGSGDAR